MEENLENMLLLLKQQLEVQKLILDKLKSIEDNLPREVSIATIERLLDGIGNGIINLEK